MASQTSATSTRSCTSVLDMVVTVWTVPRTEMAPTVRDAKRITSRAQKTSVCRVTAILLVGTSKMHLTSKTTSLFIAYSSGFGSLNLFI